MTELFTRWDTIPDQPCQRPQCGHASIVHITECSAGWLLVRGEYEAGPDACQCLGFLDPDGDAA